VAYSHETLFAHSQRNYDEQIQVRKIHSPDVLAPFFSRMNVAHYVTASRTTTDEGQVAI
jgi:hypothetical protein